VTISPDPHHNIPIVDSSRAPQEGEASWISNRRLGPEARFSDYTTEGSRKARA